MQSPSELTEIRMRMSAEYGQCADELADILELKAKSWEGIRASSKTDKEAEKRWESSEHGIKEMRLKLKMKKLEKSMSSIKTHIEVKMGEVRNLI